MQVSMRTSGVQSAGRAQQPRVQLRCGPLRAYITQQETAAPKDQPSLALATLLASSVVAIASAAPAFAEEAAVATISVPAVEISVDATDVADAAPEAIVIAEAPALKEAEAAPIAAEAVAAPAEPEVAEVAIEPPAPVAEVEAVAPAAAAAEVTEVAEPQVEAVLAEVEEAAAAAPVAIPSPVEETVAAPAAVEEAASAVEQVVAAVEEATASAVDQVVAAVEQVVAAVEEVTEAAAPAVEVVAPEPVEAALPVAEVPVEMPAETPAAVVMEDVDSETLREVAVPVAVPVTASSSSSSSFGGFDLRALLAGVAGSSSSAAADGSGPSVEALTYGALGAAAVSFIATFFIAPRFRDSFKEPVDWRAMYAALAAKGVKTVTPEEAYGKARKGAILLDVRLADKFADGRSAAGAVNVPLYRPIAGWDPASNVRRAGFAFFGIFGTELNEDFSEEVLATIPKNKEVIVLCETGGTINNKPGTQFGFQSRSLKALYYLQQAGYNKVLHLKGGLVDWQRAGLPLADGSEQPPARATGSGSVKGTSKGAASGSGKVGTGKGSKAAAKELVSASSGRGRR